MTTIVATNNSMETAKRQIQVHKHDAISNADPDTPCADPELDQSRSREREDAEEVANSDSEPEGDTEAAGESALDLNYDAIKHIASYYLPGGHGKCLSVQPLAEGTFHEVKALEFEDGWSCIGRFSLDSGKQLSVTESEHATLSYVKKHTNIPVPEVYFVNSNPDHAVNAGFMLQERMRGERLSDIWESMSEDHKLSAVEQVAGILLELGSLHFDVIGSLKDGGVVGMLQNPTISEKALPRGPYASLEDYMFSFLAEDSNRPEEVMELYPSIKAELRPCLENDHGSHLKAPFRLIHGDFDSQNMLFAYDDKTKPPQLTAVIDWDNSFTGPAYYLYEYPIFIQDNDLEPESYALNKKLRKHFVATLIKRCENDSPEREVIWESFRQKSFWLNAFRNTFTFHTWSPVRLEQTVVRQYLMGLQDGGEPAYGGRDDYEPDSEFERD